MIGFDEDIIDGGLVAQIESLYDERRRLYQALGTSDVDEIIAMVRSLEQQLVALYAQINESSNAQTPRG